VSHARVVVDGQIVGEIDRPGLFVLVGATHSDTPVSAATLASKLWHLRILACDDGRMNRSCAELAAPLLVVSQFTLYASTSRGRRLSFVEAMPGPEVEPLVDQAVETLRRYGATISTGRFGADMQVELVNDGPVTIVLEV
jgi:D-tyrosyl-tRNA(Tyr) deacylase